MIRLFFKGMMMWILIMYTPDIFCQLPTYVSNVDVEKNNLLNEYRPLKVGDSVPNISFKMLNYPKQKIFLSDFKGKLIILDFWATWCGGCVEKFPKMDSLEKKFGDQVKIIMVNSTSNTGDDKASIIKFFNKRKNLDGKTYQFDVAMEDSLAFELFAHRSVPHYVWIGIDRRVKGITESSEINEKNIEYVLKNGQINMPQKKDFYAERLLDFGETPLIIDNTMMHYSIFKKGRIEGVGILNEVRTVRNNIEGGVEVRGKAMRNMPLLDMYKEAIKRNRRVPSTFSDKRIIIETKNTLELIYDSSQSDKEQWERENLYTYDIVVPAIESDSLYRYMIDDLNHYSGYYGRMEQRKVKCMSLIRINNIDKIKTKGGQSEYMLYDDQKKKYATNISISTLITQLDMLEAINLPIFDDTNYTGNIDIELKVDHMDNISALQKALQQCGLDLIEKEKNIEMFVLTKK